MFRAWIAAALAALALAACSSPGMRFVGAEPTRVEVGGWSFDVYRAGDEAQAIRLSRAWGASAELMALRGAEAMRRATGCEPVEKSMRADPSVLTAVLRCTTG